MSTERPALVAGLSVSVACLAWPHFNPVTTWGRLFCADDDCALERADARLRRGKWPALPVRGVVVAGFGMRARVRALGIALLLSPVMAEAEPACLQGLLQRLGWQFDTAAVSAPEIHGGPVCTRADLAQAQAAGDLRVRLPAALPAAERNALLQALLDDPASHCAYGFLLGVATRQATQALQDNPGYRFSGLQLGWIGFGLRGAKTQGWQSTRSLGRRYQPMNGNSRALAAFTEGRVRSECGVGRQVAQLAGQRALYGDAAFDAAFTAEELSIGTFLSLHGTHSILLGDHAGQFTADGKAVQASLQGRQAFMGLPGYLTHAFDSSYLDDINNQAENFVVVDVSDAAAQALARSGGFADYDARNETLWMLSQQLTRRGIRFFERLLHDRDAALRGTLDVREMAVLERMDALLDDPFYQQFLIYSHPRGIKPIGYHVVRLLDRNPRTPFTVELTLHNVHTTLYHRWIQTQLQHCARTGRIGTLTIDADTR